MPKLTTAEKRARRAAYARDYYLKNRAMVLAKGKAYRAKRENRTKPTAEQRAKQRAYHDKYRARPEIRTQYQRRENSRVEANLIALAGRPRPEFCEVCGRLGRITFDHCHQRNVFRGWLCGKCNSALGFVDDDPNILRKLIAYLERTARLVPPQLTLPGI